MKFVCNSFELDNYFMSKHGKKKRIPSKLRNRNQVYTNDQRMIYKTMFRYK